jgi:5-methylcytosine-specific restriction protein A
VIIFECQMCKELGRVGKGEAVHHIKHLKDRPDLGLTDSNLVTLCLTHHNLAHPEKFKHKKKIPINEERW